MIVGIHFWGEDAHALIWNIDIFFMSDMDMLLLLLLLLQLYV